MSNLPKFDPLVFLGVKNLSNKEKNEVSQHLLSKISQYILIRISEEIDYLILKKAKNPEDVFEIAREKLIDFNLKLKEYLKDFKIEFNKNLRIR